MAEVGFHSVSKTYLGDVRAVDRLDLVVRDRELVVLVGPSGCGKSTTLRMVAGLEQITSGTIRIGDCVVNGVLPRDRDIAMVFQNHTLYPCMTVYKNMAFGLKLRRVPRREVERRVGEAARMLGIENLLDRRPKALSGGQRQRVAVGRAIVRDPACFLFDEPLSNLDAQLRVQTRAELKRLHRRLRTTTIYVTHDQEEAMTLGDRIVVMKAARVQQCGTPLAVYHHPVNRFVAGFVGTPPMNFVNGRLIVVEDSPVFEGGGLSIRLDRRRAERVRDHWGCAVVCGLRPEAFRLRAEPGSGGEGQRIELVVKVIEPLGSTMDLRCVTPGRIPVVVRVRAEPIETPSKVAMHLDSRQMYLFSPGPNGRALPMGDCGGLHG